MDRTVGIPSTSISNCDAQLFFLWSHTVKVATTSLVRPRAVVEEILSNGAAIPAFNLTKLTTNPSRSQAQLLPIEPKENGLNFVSTFSEQAAVAVSVVFRRSAPKELGTSRISRAPIQMANLKRQLVGIHVLYREAHFTTMVSISLEGETYELCVERIAYQPTVSDKSSQVFLVAPSTRITVIDWKEPCSSNVDSSNSACAGFPPSTKLLLDTISIMDEYGSSVDIPRMFLFTGPPGVGKTYAVKTSSVNAPLHAPRQSVYSKFLRGSDIVADNDGDPSAVARNLEKVFAGLRRHNLDRTCLIFLDECDALLSSSVARAVLAAQLDEVSLNWKRIVIVAATNKVDSVPQALRRCGRFEQDMNLRPPSSSQRYDILRNLVPEEVCGLKELSETTIGFVPADLHALIRRAKLLRLVDNSSLVESLRQALVDVGASALRDSALSKPTQSSWDTIAGDAGGAKTSLVQSIEWPRSKERAFLRLGLSSPRGVLLHGPPGCAKTSLARAAAGSESIAFLSLSPADVFSSYVGDAEAVIRRAFATARSAAPCILFFDEIDAILGSNVKPDGHGMHRSGGRSAENRVLSTFLNESDGLTSMDGDRVIVIGATNRPSTLDAALLRPGRFDKVIYVPPPDLEGRLAILENQLKPHPLGQHVLRFDLARLAGTGITGKMTGAEIMGACREAAARILRGHIGGRTFSVPEQQEMLETHLRDVSPILSNPRVLEEYIDFERRRQKQ